MLKYQVSNFVPGSGRSFCCELCSVCFWFRLPVFLFSLSSLFSSLPPSVSLSAFPLRPLLLPSQEIVFRNQSQIINHVQERKCRLLPFTFIPAKSLFLSSLAARDAFSQNSKTGFQWHPLPLFSSPSLLSSLCCRCSSDCIDTGD